VIFSEFNDLLEQKNSRAKLLSDLLSSTLNEIHAFIKSIFIYPNRDLNAPLNKTPLSNFRPANITFEKKLNIDWKI
jgi:hypothetical protein